MGLIAHPGCFQAFSKGCPLFLSYRDPKKEVEAVTGLIQRLSDSGGEGGADRLQLLETIGGGAQGTVFRGKWRNLDVAIKASEVAQPRCRNKGKWRNLDVAIKASGATLP